jgi:hypothetical protein
MIAPPDVVRVWIAAGEKCLQDTHPSPSYVETCLIGLRSLTKDPRAKAVHEKLLLHLEDSKRSWKKVGSRR